MADWHPIRVVSRRTGLSPHVIRAWEKRYGAVEPHRTPTNRRVYSTDDVERLSLLKRATMAGRSIGQIAKLSSEELRAVVEEDEAAQRRAGVPPPGVEASTRVDGGKLLKAALHAAEHLDAAVLQAVLDRASVNLSRPALMNEMLVPLMHRIGDAWRDGSVRVAHEHLASAVVRSFVGNLNGSFLVAATAPEIIVTTPAGQLHEIGALLAAATAAAEGWRPTYLGPSLPADDIAAAAAQNQARAIALSLVYPGDDPHMKNELTRLSHLVPQNITVLVGGRSASSYRSTIEALGFVYIDNLDDFRSRLEDLRTPK
jgi:DNA-binding transcriptional MerR regulator/methylmalonyl-CoA mutase cobalamin-binding subunit